MIERTRVAFAALAAAALVLSSGAPLADPTEEEIAGWSVDPDYAAGKRAIEAKDWTAAIKALASAALRASGAASLANLGGISGMGV